VVVLKDETKIQPVTPMGLSHTGTFVVFQRMQVHDTFTDLRPYLFSIAYRMLSSVTDAEDIVQEAFVRWQRATDVIDAPKAYLSRVVTRLCIDHLRSARVRREAYIGPWLPEPLITDAASDAAETTELADLLSMAFLVLLESLSPVERAVFLLREVFGYDYVEIATTVGKSQANCRQIVARARQRIGARRKRFTVSKREASVITAEFIEACLGADHTALLKLLAPDVTLYSDGGGQVRAARRPIVGADKVARFLLAVARNADVRYELRSVEINRQPGLIVSVAGRPIAVFVFDVADQLIQGIRTIVNPAKLRALRSHPSPVARPIWTDPHGNG
jgi:RNA polymerase sigma-70 factor, ECF subfamily